MNSLSSKNQLYIVSINIFLNISPFINDIAKLDCFIKYLIFNNSKIGILLLTNFFIYPIFIYFFICFYLVLYQYFKKISNFEEYVGFSKLKVQNFNIIKFKCILGVVFYYSELNHIFNS